MESPAGPAAGHYVTRNCHNPHGVRMKDRQGSKELNIERTNIRFGHQRNALGEREIFGSTRQVTPSFAASSLLSSSVHRLKAFRVAQAQLRLGTRVSSERF